MKSAQDMTKAIKVTRKAVLDDLEKQLQHEMASQGTNKINLDVLDVDHSIVIEFGELLQKNGYKYALMTKVNDEEVVLEKYLHIVCPIG